MMYGRDFDYAENRLSGSIVRLVDSGEPIQVVDIDHTGRCRFFHLDGRDSEPVFCNLNDLNVRPVPLGYVNCGKSVAYLMRVPKRRDWKQGLRRNSCYSSGQDFEDLHGVAIRNCILGRYPTFDRAVNITLGDKPTRNDTAFSRHWAINSRGWVLYKNHMKVGVIEGGAVKLDSEFLYLREVLTGSTNVNRGVRVQD